MYMKTISLIKNYEPILGAKKEAISLENKLLHLKVQMKTLMKPQIT